LKQRTIKAWAVVNRNGVLVRRYANNKVWTEVRIYFSKSAADAAGCDWKNGEQIVRVTVCTEPDQLAYFRQ
jgi:hypothetical protein